MQRRTSQKAKRKVQKAKVEPQTRPDENLFPYPPSADLNKRVMMGEPLTDAETL